MSKFSITDKLFFQYLIAKRGRICEIHQKECPSLGTMHILSKATAPRLRYDPINAVLAGWFCSHFYTHHDPDDPRAVFARKRICELRGYGSWEALRFDFKLREKMKGRIDFKLQNMYFRNEIKRLSA